MFVTSCFTSPKTLFTMFVHLFKTSSTPGFGRKHLFKPRSDFARGSAQGFRVEVLGR